MTHLIPLSRVARLVGQPRSLLQQMAQQGELKTFDGQVELDEVLRHFPGVALDNETELRRVEEIKENAIAKPAARAELPDSTVLHARLKTLGREFAAARGRLKHHDRVHGWIADRLAAAVEAGEATPRFADGFLQWLRRELGAPSSDFQPWEDLLALERVMQVMSAQVTIEPSGQTFEVMGDETLLEAGLRAGLSLPYGCSNGTCGQCKCRVTRGQVVKVAPHDYTLSGQERRESYTLACAYTAVGDIAIEVPLWGVADIPEQTIVARVRQVEPLGARHMALHLLTPRAERLRYLAGQELDITIGGVTQRVPGAGCPCEERRIEVHVATGASGIDRGALERLKPNDEVVVRGPFGHFVLDDRSLRPVLLIAAGPGFAPVKSLLQHALSLEHAPLIALYRLADEEGLYQSNLLKSYAAALDHFRYEPFPPGTAASDAISQIIADCTGTPPEGLAGFDVYAAGPDALIAETRSRLLAAGLGETHWKGMTLA
jgi:CDP-4-dehydro-6-deoxyglucose reductase